jgi:hypothetical protein
MQEVQQDHSYLVVCESGTDTYDATPLSTAIVGNVVYFKSAKNQNNNTISNYEYNLYYGRDYIKYINSKPYYDYNIDELKTIFIQDDQTTINYYTTANNSMTYAPYSATPSQINLYQHEVNSSSSDKYLMTFFNDGIDWNSGYSTKEGAKVSVNFDGPNFILTGNKGPDYGIFKYRIIQKAASSDDIESVVINWTEVDCYSFQLSEQTLVSRNDLDYSEYFLEIETMSEKNTLSYGNNIYIKNLKFLRNFSFIVGEEELNPDLSFISIGGIR